MTDVDSLDLTGAIDEVTANRISGWVIDLVRKQALLPLAVLIDGQIVSNVAADLYRPDVAEIGHSSPYVGFAFDIPRSFSDGKDHTIQLACNGHGPISLPGPESSTHSTEWHFTGIAKEPSQARSSGAIVVHLDHVSEQKISGWAYDEGAVHIPPSVELYVDDELVSAFRADQLREDVQNSGFVTAVVGFSAEVPSKFFDDTQHILSFKSGDGKPIRLEGEKSNLEQRKQFLFASTKVFGRVDGLHSGAIRGWALTENRLSGKKTGGLSILVTMQGQPVGQVKANQFRADVAESLEADPNCGFVFVPPIELVAGKTVELRFKIIPGAVELEQSPIAASFYGVTAQKRLGELEGMADQIFTQAWALRAAIKALRPAESHTLLSYDAWARSYYQTLMQRTPSLDVLSMEEEVLPLVSIICPTYKPRIADFLSAVQSVLRQTYKKWELLIVDDGSQSPELRETMDSLAKSDERIKPVFLEMNGGISVATNVSIQSSKGRYVAMFDHDDLLVEKALEFMVSAALQTGAKVLYSDEDKIDDDGVYSEVNIKPDWNHRLLLSQNYVCHLLMVKSSHLAKVGLFRSECDGAQDHDLILRLAAVTPQEEIHHVREILYHWRKTPFSTAASGKAKPYAVASGILAVSDHLKALHNKAIVKKYKLTWEVCSHHENAIYQIRWNVGKQPRVTIVIPYREQIEMTTICICALKKFTNYANYEILLVDNWSTSDESYEFSRRIGEDETATSLRVEESFNYSRINNLAAAASSGEFLLFLNNDVIVSEPDWLMQMVGEALVDSRVGIVGSKLLYPNGLVQHGGIILGVGGVADHAHRGLSGSDPGYMARAICAQELSAVTAACMLCRRDVFQKVGGFDESDLRVAFNDVDLCLKVRKLGYHVVWTPTSVAEHRESVSRENDFRPDQQARFFHENQVMKSRWGDILEDDPCYGRFFSRNSGLFMDLAAPQKI